MFEWYQEALFAEGSKLFGREVRPVVCDDTIGDPEAIYDGFYELD